MPPPTSYKGRRSLGNPNRLADWAEHPIRDLGLIASGKFGVSYVRFAFSTGAGVQGRLPDVFNVDSKNWNKEKKKLYG